MPTPLQVDEFVAVCSEYLEKNPDSYIGTSGLLSSAIAFGILLTTHEKDGGVCCIGVHCTHGFNRTGYMICSYLYQYVGFAMDTAIEAFTASRSVGARGRPPMGISSDNRRVRKAI